MENTKTQHPYNCIKIKDRATIFERYSIQVFLDCSCGNNEDQSIVAFVDNDLLSAEDNFKGWFSNTCQWFIQNGYKIIDCRRGKECTE